MTTRNFTAIVQRDGDEWVAFCPELDIASQGDSIEEAKAQLREAVELFLETADAEEIKARSGQETYFSQLEVSIA